jgi:hypothetical protein
MKQFSHCGSYESWQKVSLQLVCCLRAKSFASFYTSLRGNAEYELEERKAELMMEDIGQMADPTGKRKRTTQPGKRNVDNLILVTEILVCAGIHETVPNRPLDADHFWRTLDAITSNVKGLGKSKNDPKLNKCCQQPELDAGQQRRVKATVMITMLRILKLLIMMSVLCLTIMKILLTVMKNKWKQG